jgi:hypothetical protein
MHRHHSCFLQALGDKRKIRIIYRRGDRREDVKALVCIPLAHVPGRPLEGEPDNYHFLDPERAPEDARLDLKSDQIMQMMLDRESFDPAEFAMPDVQQTP